MPKIEQNCWKLDENWLKNWQERIKNTKIDQKSRNNVKKEWKIGQISLLIVENYI